jgi:hypothetical protein
MAVVMADQPAAVNARAHDYSLTGDGSSISRRCR